MTRVYIAGPMSGIADHNFPAFFAAEDALSRMGYEPVNPARIDVEQGWDAAWPAEAYMKRDLPALLTCDAIALLNGWDQSRGALYEALVAMITGKDALRQLERGPGQWERGWDGIDARWLVGRLLSILALQSPKDRKVEVFARSVVGYEDPPRIDLIPDAPAPDVPTTWEEGLDAVLREMRSIMVERQDKYGPQNILQQGLLGVLTRATDDKIERIRGALDGKVVRGRVVLDPIEDGTDAQDTFDDGCLDAANYLGPIMLMLRRGWWTLPREEK